MKRIGLLGAIGCTVAFPLVIGAGILSNCGGNAYSVSSLPGLRFWVDPTDTPSFTLQDTDKIAAWNDKSGAGNHFEVAPTFTRPTLTPNSINGLPAVAFNGTTDVLRQSVASPLVSGPTSIFIVVKMPTGVSGYPRIFSWPTGSPLSASDSGSIGYSSDSSYGPIQVGVGGYIKYSGTADSETHILSLTYKGGTYTDPANVIVAQDGVVQTGTIAVTNFGYGLTRAFFACFVTNDNPVEMSNPLVGEVIISDELDSAQATATYNYLSAKWKGI